MSPLLLLRGEVLTLGRQLLTFALHQCFQTLNVAFVEVTLLVPKGEERQEPLEVLLVRAALELRQILKQIDNGKAQAGDTLIVVLAIPQVVLGRVEELIDNEDQGP